MPPLNLNRVFLAGFIASHPELRFIPSGKAVAEFMLGIEPDDEGPSHSTEAQIFPVIAWEELAVSCESALRPGDRVWVEGKLAVRSFRDSSDHICEICEIVAETVKKKKKKKKPRKRAEKKRKE